MSVITEGIVSGVVVNKAMMSKQAHFVEISNPISWFNTRFFVICIASVMEMMSNKLKLLHNLFAAKMSSSFFIVGALESFKPLVFRNRRDATTCVHHSWAEGSLGLTRTAEKPPSKSRKHERLSN